MDKEENNNDAPTNAPHEHHAEGGHEHHEAAHHAHEQPAEVKEAAPVAKAHKPAKKKKAAKRKAQKAVHHEVKEAPKKKKGYLPYVIGAIVLIVVIALIVRLASNNGYKPNPVVVDNPSQYGMVDVNFYVMSQCPYGVQVEDGIAPVLEEIGSNVNFKLDFIASGSAGAFNSLHGPNEVAGDKIQLCVQKYFPAQLMKFVSCQNKDVQNIVTSVDKCAKEAGIDAAKITSCSTGSEGSSLLTESIKNSEDVQAQGSPTIFINKQSYTGGRDAASFKRAICSNLKGHPGCEGIPACSADTDCRAEAGKVGLCENPGKKDAKCSYKDDEAITLTVVNAKECKTCDPSQLTTVLQNVFLNMQIKEVDASSTEGKALIKSMGLTSAPSYVFSAGVDKTYAWNNNVRMQGAFRKVGESFVLLDEASGATYLLDAKKRAELETLTGVKKGDNKPQIDFYVMSYCPYGNMAEDAIEPAYQVLKGVADFNPHYVIYSNYQGGGPNYCMDAESKYCSMHGVQEMNQDIREICVHKYDGDTAYFKFVMAMNTQCSASNADTCWEKVAKSVGLDSAKIKTCEKDEGLALAENELKLNKALGVSGSPTIFVEGEQYGGARTPAGVAQALCGGFETAPDACSADNLAPLGAVDSAAPAAAAGAGCG